MDKKRAAELLEGTVEQIKPRLAGLTNSELNKLHDAEEAGENRSSLLRLIDAARENEEKSSAFVDGLNVPLATATPKNEADPVVFQQGRAAALGSISKDDAPYDKSDKRYSSWLSGWESVKG